MAVAARSLLLAVALAAALAAGPGRADWLQGWRAAAGGDWRAAAAAWRPGAEAGHIDLRFHLGQLHESGLLGGADYRTAARWYEAAGRLPAALHRLAGLALRGLGMAADAERAMALLGAAAEAGYAPAQYNFAAAWEAGLHLPPDLDRAALWYRRAADRGMAAAQYALGRLLAADDGGLPRALARYRAAAEAGYAPAQNNLALMYERGEGVARDPATARAWYRRAAASGLAVAQNNLGVMLRYGHGIASDPAAAAASFRDAAMGGDPFGQLNFAQALANGIGVAPDGVEAHAWILLARRSGDEAAAAQAADYAAGLAPRLDREQRHRAARRARLLAVRVAAEMERRRLRPPRLLAVEELGAPVVAAQRYLLELGYLAGWVDGRAGPATMQALRRFRRDAGLAGAGAIDEALAALLASAWQAARQEEAAARPLAAQ